MALRKDVAKMSNKEIAIDLTTVAADNDNKCYIVDQRLLDFLLSKVVSATLEDIKQDLKTEINYADTKEDLFKRLDDYIYLNNIVSVVKKDVEVEETYTDTVFNNQ